MVDKPGFSVLEGVDEIAAAQPSTPPTSPTPQVTHRTRKSKLCSLEGINEHYLHDRSNGEQEYTHSCFAHGE